MKRKESKFGKQLIRNLEKCELCNKKGRIKHKGSLFCSEEHVRLFEIKWNEAEERMKKIKACSICRKPVRGGKKTLIDCSIKKIGDAFMPYVFCSEKCFELWGTE